jgi:hypothetical protein
MIVWRLCVKQDLPCKNYGLWQWSADKLQDMTSYFSGKGEWFTACMQRRHAARSQITLLWPWLERGLVVVICTRLHELVHYIRIRLPHGITQLHWFEWQSYCKIKQIYSGYLTGQETLHLSPSLWKSGSYPLKRWRHITNCSASSRDLCPASGAAWARTLSNARRAQGRFPRRGSHYWVFSLTFIAIIDHFKCIKLFSTNGTHYVNNSLHKINLCLKDKDRVFQIFYKAFNRSK